MLAMQVTLLLLGWAVTAHGYLIVPILPRSGLTTARTEATRMVEEVVEEGCDEQVSYLRLHNAALRQPPLRLCHDIATRLNTCMELAISAPARHTQLTSLPAFE